MKPVNLLFKAAFLLILCAGFIPASPVSHCQEASNSTKIEVVFTHSMTNADLQKISADLKKNKNIDLVYERKSFDARGHLKALKFKVNCNDGFQGGASTWNLKKRFGFIRDYKNKQQPFIVGFL